MATYDHTKFTMAAATFAYAIGFDYAQTADVKVYINDVLQTPTTDYIFTSAGTEITIDAGVGHVDNDILDIKRVTDISTLLVTFSSGSSLTGTDLNKALRQLLYSIDELQVPAYDTGSTYKSVNVLVLSAADIVYPHNLGAVPTRVQTLLKCTSGELGYSTGDIMDANNAYVGPVVFFDATNITISWKAAQNISIPNLTTGTPTAITDANWGYRIMAWR